jgi:hypothetical protein
MNAGRPFAPVKSDSSFAAPLTPKLPAAEFINNPSRVIKRKILIALDRILTLIIDVQIASDVPLLKR